jgi:uncharacterized protein YjbJ (UPF0337 family)
MSTTDKVKNKAQEVRGKVKEKAGEATGDRDLQTQGKVEGAKGNLKQAGEKVKDAVKH